MKRLVLVALLCVLLGAVAFAETEDEARAALQNTLMELEETYGAELLPEEQMQLSFLIDWADRYVESEQWAQFAEDFGQCQDAQKLSELLNTDYMGINQAEEGLMQREEARQRSIEIVQAAGFDLEQMPYVSLGSKGGWNGWEVRVSQIPGDEQRTPGVMLDLANDGAVRYMEYLGEPTEAAIGGRATSSTPNAAIGAAISEQRAQEIALAFMTQYVDAEGEAACTAQAEDSHWKVTFEGQADQQPCEVWIDNQTGAVLLVETFTR